MTSYTPSDTPESKRDRKWKQDVARRVQQTPKMISNSVEEVTSTGSGEDSCLTATLPAGFFAELNGFLEFYIAGTESSFGDFTTRLKVDGTTYASLSFTGDSGGTTHGWILRGRLTKKDDESAFFIYERIDSYNGIRVVSNPSGGFSSIDLSDAKALEITIESSGVSQMKFKQGSLILWPGPVT